MAFHAYVLLLTSNPVTWIWTSLVSYKTSLHNILLTLNRNVYKAQLGWLQEIEAAEEFTLTSSGYHLFTSKANHNLTDSWFFFFFWGGGGVVPTQCPKPALEPWLNSNFALQGPFRGDAPNMIFSIPRARTQDSWSRVKQSHHYTITHVGILCL